jgi:hypothetical protein
MDEDLALTEVAVTEGPALTLERRVKILKVLLARAQGKGIVAACEAAGIVRQTWYNWEKAGLVRQALADEKGEVNADLSALLVSEMREMVQSMVDLVKNGKNESARVKAFQVVREFWQEIQAESQRDLTDFFSQYDDRYGPEREKMPQMVAQVNIGQVIVQGGQRGGEVIEGESTPIGEDEQAESRDSSIGSE